MTPKRAIYRTGSKPLPPSAPNFSQSAPHLRNSPRSSLSTSHTGRTCVLLTWEKRQWTIRNTTYTSPSCFYYSRKKKIQKPRYKDPWSEINSWILQMLRYKDPWSEINSWILHILPTLVNLQGDDQLDRAD